MNVEVAKSKSTKNSMSGILRSHIQDDLSKQKNINDINLSQNSNERAYEDVMSQLESLAKESASNGEVSIDQLSMSAASPKSKEDPP